MNEIRRCSKCILPANFRNIYFDKNNTCNYCNTYDLLKDKLCNYDYLKKLLIERFDSVRGKYEYDCLVGISGGKDSCYIAYTLVKDYNLRVLTFTYNNGFLSDYAKRNIDLVIKKLKLDHFYYSVDWSIHGKFYKSAIEKLGLPCLGCSYLGGILMNKLAYERRIPFFVHGRSRAQMFKELAPGSLDAFVPFIKCNISPYNIHNVKNAGSDALAMAFKLLNRVIPDEAHKKKIIENFFPDLHSYFNDAQIPEFLAFFLYEQYDEKKMMDILERELGWKRPDSTDILGHQDCIIHDAAIHLNYQVLGYPLLAQELSVMVRENDLTREEAMKRLYNEEALYNYPKGPMNELCKRTDIDEADINKIIKRNRKKHKLMRLLIRIKYFIKKPILEI
ncbi:MAG: hypothetical protein A2176_05395 [Spirochaetes bacterium RBG_13_51_14]|nr:MAG: hypothetical protein A2176_05395 [Spirochaetes bacterium RBG_13_51_14]